MGRPFRRRTARAEASQPAADQRLSIPVQIGPVQIREARSSEFDAVGNLTVTAYAPVLRFGERDPYTESLADAPGRAAVADLLVAVVGDNLVGTVTIGRPGTAYAEVAGDDEFEVRMLAVAPGLQRLGVGRALMHEVHRRAESEGVAAVVLSVIATNTVASAFYQQLGYQRLPERDWVPVPDVVLEVWIRPVTPRS